MPARDRAHSSTLSRDRKPLSAIAGGLPRYVIVKDKLDRPKASLESVYSSLREAFADARVDTQDGLRLAWKDRWLHVRPSGTSHRARDCRGAHGAGARELVRVHGKPLDRLNAPATVGAAG